MEKIQKSVVSKDGVVEEYYIVNDLDDNFVLRKARLQDPKNRQNSVITDDVNLHLVWEQHQRTVWQTAMRAYNWAIDKFRSI